MLHSCPMLSAIRIIRNTACSLNPSFVTDHVDINTLFLWQSAGSAAYPGQSPVNQVHDFVKRDLAKVIPDNCPRLFHMIGLKQLKIRQTAKSRCLKSGTHVVDDAMPVVQFYRQSEVVIGNDFVYSGHINHFQQQIRRFSGWFKRNRAYSYPVLYFRIHLIRLGVSKEGCARIRRDQPG